MTHTLTTGTIHIFTYREGLLSRMGHDLQLTLADFSVEIDPDARRASGRFRPASLQVDGAIEGGRLEVGALKDKDRRDIHQNICRKILHTATHPEITFTGEVKGGVLGGELTMVGRAAPIQVRFIAEGGRLKGEATLTPTRWGVAPYKALMGAIKLQDRVTVRFDLPDPR